MKISVLILAILCGLPLFSQQKGASPLPTANSEQPTANQTYAVVVGISDYQDEGIPDLRFADKDAEAFAGFLQSPAGGSLDEDHLKVLINEKATVAQFAIALDWLWEVVKEDDRVIIYFSGHGDVERKSITQPGYLLCWDAPSRIYLAGGALALPMFQDVITTLSAQNKAKVVVITDACRSGKLSGSSVGGAQITGSNLARQYANEIKILSCQPDEFSIEGEQWGGGRGAFSYHLLDGLYGMADKDSNGSVSLREIDRYLEDNVTPEVAPQDQLPMVVGDSREKLTDVFPEILAQLEEAKKGKMPLFTATESRGIEGDVLAAADTNIVEMYFAFKKALKDKQFLFAEKGRPENEYADYYYEKLIAEQSLQRLHSSMRRNYAAALQDDAQQTMNNWMKSSDQELFMAKENEIEKNNTRLPIKVFTEKVKTFPDCLERATELLGKNHYMYATLQARKHFFKGYLIANSNRNLNPELGERALATFRQALQWQPELPQAYWQMMNVYAYNLDQPDSAEVFAQKAIELYPSWVRPYTDLGYILIHRFNQLDRAKSYLEQIMQLDSNSAFVWQSWGVYSQRQKKYEQAEYSFKKAIQLDSAYIPSYSYLGHLYYAMKRKQDSEHYYKKATELDSTLAMPFSNLGWFYTITRRFEEGEKYLKKAILLDSNYITPWFYIGDLYRKTDRYKEAVHHLKKAIQLAPAHPIPYIYLGLTYNNMRRWEDAEKQYKKAIQINSITNIDVNIWTAYANLGWVYIELDRWEASAEMTQKAIDMVPEIGSLYGQLGLAYTNLPDRSKDAKAALDKALEMSPDFWQNNFYLLLWFQKNNQPENAWLYLEKGIQQGVEKGQLKLSDLQDDPDFAEMKKEEKWTELMQKYFPDQAKD